MTSLENPEHPVPYEVAAAVEALQTRQRADLDCRNQILRADRPTSEERRALRNILARNATRPQNSQTGLAELAKQQSDRITGDIAGISWPQHNPVFLNEFPPTPPSPPATDHWFWWARTDCHVDRPYDARFTADGLRITGELRHRSGNLIFRNIEATALFELQAERIPQSANGVWESQPQIELFGGITGHIPRGHFFVELPFIEDPDDDYWSKCWLNLSQTIFQVAFGEEPTEVLRGMGAASRPLLILENSSNNNILSHSESSSVFAAMPGSIAMPPVTVRNINPGDNLWAALSITISTQMEGDGSMLRIGPDLVLRTFQWPLRAM